MYLIFFFFMVLEKRFQIALHTFLVCTFPKVNWKKPLPDAIIHDDFDLNLSF